MKKHDSETNHQEVTMGKTKKAAAKTLKQKRAAKQAKAAARPSAKSVSKTARASGASG